MSGFGDPKLVPRDAWPRVVRWAHPYLAAESLTPGACRCLIQWRRRRKHRPASAAFLRLTCLRARRKQLALAGILRQQRRALEFPAGLVGAAELGKKVAPDARR